SGRTVTWTHIPSTRTWSSSHNPCPWGWWRARRRPPRLAISRGGYPVSEPLVTAVVALLLAVAGLIASVTAWIHARTALTRGSSHEHYCRTQALEREVRAYSSGYDAGYAAARAANKWVD